MTDSEKTYNPSDHIIKVQGGADYLPVAPRIPWIRQEHPEAKIETRIEYIDDKNVTFKATITLPNGATATGHAREVMSGGSGAARYNPLETCETSAIGRALAFLGYGTLDASRDAAASGDRIVDSPVQRNEFSGGSAVGKPATTKQVNFVRSLLKEKKLTDTLIEEYIESLDLTTKTAADLIKALREGDWTNPFESVDQETGEIQDIRPKSAATKFWELANSMGLKNKQAVSERLGRDISNDTDFTALHAELEAVGPF